MLPPVVAPIAKTRALQSEDKEQRRHDILVAAEKLLLADLTKMPSVDDVARQAGLAKGTVYLYFPSKEELLLAIHQSNSDHFFENFTALLALDTQCTLEAMLHTCFVHIVEREGYLPLAARCFAMMDKDLPIKAVLQHKANIAAWLTLCAKHMQRHWPHLGQREAIRLLQNTYATMLGQWMMLHPVPRLAPYMGEADLSCLARDFKSELSFALMHLWRTTLTPELVAPSRPASKSP